MSALDNRDPATLLRLADRVSLTIIDEAHQAIAPTYAAILTALYSKRPHNALLGLTATPGRSWSDIGEDRKLSDDFDGRKVTLEVERTSVVSGKSVSVRVDLGGRRNIKKKRQTTRTHIGRPQIKNKRT